MLNSEHIDNFKCVVYCNAESDGSITTAAFDDIRDGMADWASGLELSIIQYYLDSLGSVGLQRQGNSLGITTGHCDDCDCDECPYIDFTDPNFTAVVGTVSSGGHSGNCLKRTGHYSEYGYDNILTVEFATSTIGCAAVDVTLWVYIDWGNDTARDLLWFLFDDTHTLIESGTLFGSVPRGVWVQRSFTLTSPLSTSGVYLRIITGAEGQDGDLRIDDIAFNEA
jgi:hypothetical protein